MIVYSSNPETTMSFLTKFVADFSIFKINPELDKYSFNAFDSLLPTWQIEAPRFEVKNEDEGNMENLFDFN